MRHYGLILGKNTKNNSLKMAENSRRQLFFEKERDFQTSPPYHKKQK